MQNSKKQSKFCSLIGDVNVIQFNNIFLAPVPDLQTHAISVHITMYMCVKRVCNYIHTLCLFVYFTVLRNDVRCILDVKFYRKKHIRLHVSVSAGHVGIFRPLGTVQTARRVCNWS